MKLAVESQVGPITDTARARIAMVRPILRAMLFSLKRERVDRFGGHEKITMADLAREYREGSGDCGICFEYAVHDALRHKNEHIHPLVSELLEEFCNIKGGAESILFGAEKGGVLELIETENALLTDDSRVLAGGIGQPPKLKRHLATIRKSLRVPGTRKVLPPSISGLWRADLFVGSPSEDRWVATTLKTNAADLEAGAGIRIGIYPEKTINESPRKDDTKNLILCPLPYNASFMELFYSSFYAIKQFLTADARIPAEVALPRAEDRHVASELEARRAFPLLDVLAALEPIGQPGLLESHLAGDAAETKETDAIAPVAQTTK